MPPRSRRRASARRHPSRPLNLQPRRVQRRRRALPHAVAAKRFTHMLGSSSNTYFNTFLLSSCDCFTCSCSWLIRMISSLQAFKCVIMPPNDTLNPLIRNAEVYERQSSKHRSKTWILAPSPAPRHEATLGQLHRAIGPCAAHIVSSRALQAPLLLAQIAHRAAEANVFTTSTASTGPG